MELKRKGVLLVFVMLFSFSLASAGLFSPKITGNVVDSTSYNNSNLCADSDGGVFSFVGGVVSWDGVLSTSYKLDKCSKSGKSLTEYYCNSKGKYTSAAVACLGGCESVSVQFEGQSFSVGRCVTQNKSCVAITGGVTDETRKKFKNYCSNKTSYVSYSCDGANVVESVENCSLIGEFGKCTVNGCGGDCNDTDATNDINIAGKVVSGGVEYLDTCNTKMTAVKQYKCVNGKVKTVPYSEDTSFKPCGANRVCALSATGEGYCKDKYAGAETLETLNTRIAALEALVSSLSERVNLLENNSAL